MFEYLNNTQLTLFSIIFFLNLFSFSLYGFDKNRAKYRRRRIPEKTLLLSSFSFGGIGAWMGMSTFRHKTKHTLFKRTIPIAALITLSFILFIFLKI